MDSARKNASQSYYIDDNIQKENVPFSLNCVGEVNLIKQFKTQLPYGRNDYYIVYVTEGKLELEIDGKSGELHSGGIICMPPHTPFTYSNSEEDRPIRYYWMHFTGNDCEHILSECGIPVGRIARLRNGREAAYYFEDIFSELRKRRPNVDFSIPLKAQYLLLHIGRSLDTEENTGSSPVERSIKYIHTNIKKSFSVGELAAMEFLSPSRCREVFREVTGLAPLEYIAKQRIHLACELIEQGDLSLSQVAELCGFSDRLYFQRVFKKLTRVTPGEYRERLKKRHPTIADSLS